MYPVLTNLIANKYIIGGIAIVSIVIFAYIYYLRTERKIENLTHERDNLIQVVETQKNVIKQQKVDYESIIESKDQLKDDIIKLENSNKELQKKLYRETKGKKSLEELARKKSKLIEKLVNKGSKEVLKCFEKITKGEICD